jgi:hypothetical protein
MGITATLCMGACRDFSRRSKLMYLPPFLFFHGSVPAKFSVIFQEEGKPPFPCLLAPMRNTVDALHLVPPGANNFVAGLQLPLSSITE